MQPTPAITDAEWQVMEAVWQDSPATARDLVVRLAPHRGWSAGTVKTLLNRLVRKGALRFERDGKRFLYSAEVSRESCVRAETQSFLDRLFGGRTTPLLAHFAKEQNLSREELAELERILESHRERDQ